MSPLTDSVPDITALRRLEWALPPTEVSCHMATQLAEDRRLAASRPPLLMIHGAFMGAWVWERHWMGEAARLGWDCHALSLRGHGKSDGHDRRHRWLMRDYVQDVLQAIGRLDRPPVLIGHSMGAAIVERVAARYPAPATVLLGPTGGLIGPHLALQIAAISPTDLLQGLLARPLDARHEFLFASSTPRRQTLAALAQTHPLSVLNQVELALPKPLEASQSPIIVIAMAQDNLIPVHAAERYAQRRGVPLTLVPHAGHTPHLEPDHWEDALHITLQRVEHTLALQPPINQR